jgi:hypothetical protein
VPGIVVQVPRDNPAHLPFATAARAAYHVAKGSVAVDGHLPTEVTVAAAAMPDMAASLSRGRSFVSPVPSAGTVAEASSPRADELRWRDDAALAAVRTSLLAQAPPAPTQTFVISSQPTAPAPTITITPSASGFAGAGGPTPDRSAVGAPVASSTARGATLLAGGDGVRRTLSAVTLRPAGPPAAPWPASAAPGAGSRAPLGEAPIASSLRHQPIARAASTSSTASTAAMEPGGGVGGLAARLSTMLQDIDATVASLGGGWAGHTGAGTRGGSSKV